MPSLPPATHLCATLIGCQLGLLCPEPERLAPLGGAISARARSAGFHVVGEAFHFFGPHAITGALLLAESHLCFHTWPEFGVVYLDLFTCAQSETAVRAMEELIGLLAIEFFCASEMKVSLLDRNRGGVPQLLRNSVPPIEGVL